MLNYPAHLLAKAATDPRKLTNDEIREITSSFTAWHRACNGFESRLYSVTYERDQLKAENEFLIRLFDLKQEEFDVSRCSGVQTGTLSSSGE